MSALCPLLCPLLCPVKGGTAGAASLLSSSDITYLVSIGVVSRPPPVERRPKRLVVSIIGMNGADVSGSVDVPAPAVQTQHWGLSWAVCSLGLPLQSAQWS